MGIFGFLSKAHIDQGVESGDATAQIERLDIRIASNDKSIARAQRTLDGFDNALDEYTERGFITRGLKARAEQEPEREAMRQIIDEAEADNDILYEYLSVSVCILPIRMHNKTCQNYCKYLCRCSV